MPPSSSPQPYQLGPVDPEPRTVRIERDPFAPGEPVVQPKPPAPDVFGLGPVAVPPLDPATEKRQMAYMPAPRKSRSSKRMMIGVSVVVLAGIGIPSVAYFKSRSAAPVAPAVAAPAAFPAVAEPAAAVAMGAATIISRPEGAVVTIDGTPRGNTPLNLTLPVGTYTLELQNGTAKRSLPLIVETGSTVRQYVDLAPSLAESGRLEITSDPAGAQVMVDGTPRGVTPLVLSTVGPGQHRVTVSDGTMTVNRNVNVSAGTTSTVVASLAPAGAAGGWISVKTPFEMQILENGQVIGTTNMERMMLPAGRHDLEFVSTAYQFKATVSTQVPAGKTVAVPLVVPNGSLSINALPWADVWLDGVAMGTTPLGNLAVSIGDHEVVWRHPQLGERRQTVKVTAGAPIRAGMDLNK